MAPAAAVSTGEADPAAANAAASEVEVGASLSIASVSPNSGSVGDTIQITLANVPNVFNLGSVKFGCSDSACKDGAKAVDPTRNGNVVTAVVPDGAVTGLIEVNSLSGLVFALSQQNFTVTGDPTAVPLPPLPACNNKGNCDYLTSTIPVIGNVRVVLTNKIAEAVEKAFPTSGAAGGCKPSGCPIVDGETTASVSNTIGMYGFNVVYALSGPLDPPVVGQQLVNLVNQPNVLTFISQTVANDFSIVGGRFPILPPNVATTLGNAAAVFVQQSFGNQAVATALAPFLYSLNVPTTSDEIIPFVKVAATSATKALLGTFNPQQGQQALINDFFTVSPVQQQLGSAFASAISVLLGQSSPSWTGAPATDSNAVANYLGELGAAELLGETNTYTPALAATIATGLQNLFTAINTPLGASASSAFQALLNAPVVVPGQGNTPLILADYMVNSLYNFLQAPATNPPPFPNQPPLLKALAPAAGYATTNFVNSLFSPANIGTVSAGLGEFVSQVVPGVLGNQGIQDEIGTRVSDLVSVLLGDDLGAVVGPQVGDAVVALVANPTVDDALTAFVNTALGAFIGSPGVIPALADAAGTLATGQLSGTFAAALQQVQQAFRTNPAVANGVDVGLTAAVAGLLSNKAVWAAVDSTLSSLVATLLGDDGVQTALAKEVAALVAGQVKGPLGQLLGAQVGTVVVELVTNPVVQSGLQGVVDTLVSDFWTTSGVVTAFSQAAGELAAATVTGDLKTVAPQVTEALRANTDVQAGVQRAVGAAVAEFLGDRNLWSAVDGTLSAAVIELSDNPLVLNALANAVSNEVTMLLGADLGAALGPQVGAAVAQFVSNPAVVTGLIGVVDTVFSTFFGTAGVVDAFATAASQFALVVVAGGGLAKAVEAAETELTSSGAVQSGVQTAITDALDEVDTTIFGNPTVQQLLGTITTNLIEEVAGDPPVQSYVAERYGAAVASLLADTAAVDAIATQLGSVVTGLLGYPGVSTAVTESLALFAGEWLGGTSMSVALGDALRALQSDTAFIAAVNAVIPPAVNNILADTAARSAIAVVVGDEVVAALKGAGINNTFLDKVGGQVAKGTAQSLLTRKAGIALVDDLAVKLVLGMPLSDVTGFVGDEVLHKPALQVALGLSIGQGVGSLFGDNIFGRLIGTIVGIPTAITISVVSGLLNFYAWLSGGWAVVPVFGPAQAVPAAADGRFTIAGLALAEPDGDQPSSLDFAMTVDAGGIHTVSFQFPLDSLLAS